MKIIVKYKMLSSGSQIWFQNGKWHRNNKPALMIRNIRLAWCQYGDILRRKELK